MAGSVSTHPSLSRFLQFSSILCHEELKSGQRFPCAGRASLALGGNSRSVLGVQMAARKGSECTAVLNCKGGTCWWNSSHTRKLSCWEEGQKQGLRVPAIGAGCAAHALDPPCPASHLPSTSTKTSISTNSQRATEQSGSLSILVQDYSAGGDCELLNQWTPTFHICLQQVALIKPLQKKKKRKA